MQNPQIYQALGQHRTEIACLRLALQDLYECLPALLQQSWRQSLQSRIQTIHATQAQLPKDQQAALLRLAKELELLQQALTGQAKQQTNDV